MKGEIGPPGDQGQPGVSGEPGIRGLRGQSVSFWYKITKMKKDLYFKIIFQFFFQREKLECQEYQEILEGKE